MPTVALIDVANSASNEYHPEQMMDRFDASSPGAGWTIQHYLNVAGATPIQDALDDGHRILAMPSGLAFIAPSVIETIREAGAILICCVQDFSYARSTVVGAIHWPAIAAIPVNAAGGDVAVVTSYGPSAVVGVETNDLTVSAPSWAVASAAAILTRYPEAATNPQAAVARMLASAEPVGGERWNERRGFGVARTFDHALVGAPIRTGETPTSSALYGAGGTATAVAGGYRYTRTSTHDFLVAYRSMPGPGAGNGARWTFNAHNHHATQAVRLRSQFGGGFVVLEPGQSGSYTIDSFSSSASYFIETTEGVGGEVDVTVTNLTQDVYEHVTTLPDLAPEGGVLSPIVKTTETATPGKVSVSLARLGGVGASVRVDGVERLQTTASEALLYLPAGTHTVEARAILPGGGVTEPHAPGTVTVAITQGYIPPAPTLDVQRGVGTLVVSGEAEGATSLVVTAQAGAETPVPVEDVEVVWPAHLPARVVAVAVGAGGTSAAATTLVPAQRVEPVAGIHPRAVLG